MIQNSTQDFRHQPHSTESSHDTLNGLKMFTYLSVTDYHDFFVPICHAVTGHKNVITKKVFVKKILSEFVNEIKNKELEKETLTSGARGELDPDQETRLANEISALNAKKTSRETTLVKPDMFCRYVFHSTSGDPSIMVRCVMRTSSSDSDVVSGLEILRQMDGSHVCRICSNSSSHSSQAIMAPTEWNP